MKKLFMLIGIVFLCQSCFTYRAMENDPLRMESGKTYKVEENQKTHKVVFKSIKDSMIVVSENFEEKQIPIKEIETIQKRKFSVVKTVGLPLVVAAVLTGIFALTYN